MKKVWFFRIIAISIPILFFVILELSLRILGYGHDYTLFIENPDAPQYLLPRPDVVRRYFPQNADVPTVTIETNFFKKKKPKNGIRIFVQGGSTAAGFPFGYGASIAGMLDYRLKKSFPDRPVEVINTALAAVNSFTMLDFSDEIIAQKPDAILIYAGHNEYLGILGVGSAYTAANSFTSTRLFLKLRKFRTFQLLQNIYHALSTDSSNDALNTKNKQNKSRTFMAKVAKNKNIAKDSSIYNQGLEQFNNNISDLLQKYNAAGIPVFISTIASNLKDQPPFSSNEIPSSIMKENSALFAAIKSNKISADQLSKIQLFAEKYHSANLFYFLGRYFIYKQKFALAKSYFTAARDHDLLRFRAPSEINQIITDNARKHQAYLVDTNSAFEKNSPHKIIGHELILEHLHPNIKGYFIIADSFYKVLEKSHLFGTFPINISTAEAAKEIPLFPAEIYWGKAKIAALMADYPFTSKPQKPDFPPLKNWSDQMGYAAYMKKSSWLDIAIQTIKRSKNNAKYLVMSAKLLAEALPNRADYNFQAGVLLIQNKLPQEAPRYLKRAIALQPKNINFQLALSHAYIQQKRYKAALPWLNSVLKYAPNNQTAIAARKKIKQFIHK